MAGGWASLMFPGTSRQARTRALTDFLTLCQWLPELRGLWTAASVNESGNLLDLSGQGRTLTNNNAATRAVHHSLIPYADLNGTNQYFSRADEAGLDITGAMTLGTLFWWDSVAAATVAVAKNAGAGQRGYALYQNAPTLTAQVSSDGTATTTATYIAMSASRMNFIWLRYNPSSYLDVGQGSLWARNTASIPAATFNNTSSLTIGSNNAGVSPADGRFFASFLCAAAVGDDYLAALAEAAYPLTGGAV